MAGAGTTKYPPRSTHTTTLATPVYRTAAFLSQLVHRLPIGTNLSLAYFFLALAAKVGPLAAISAFKLGFDEGKCIAVEHNNATTTAGQLEAAADCASRGGTVSEVNGQTTVCEVQVSR